MRSRDLARTMVLGPLLGMLLSSAAMAGTPAAGFVDEASATGLSSPTAIAFLPDGRMLITEKGGALKLNDGGSVSTLTTITVCTGSEMGLLGIAVDPDYATNGFVYLYRTKPGTSGCGSVSTRFNQVVRVTLAGNPPAFVAGSLVELLTGIRTDNGNHDGGGLRIGPDEKLYVAVGDTGLGDNQGGPGSSTNPYAADLGALEGKVLRLELDGGVPADNPFVATPGARGEIFAYGFRNPFRFGFDPVTGRLWLGDVGDLTLEEIDIVAAGGHYGWPDCEGNLPAGCPLAGQTGPILVYPRSGGSSLGRTVIGGDFGSSLFGVVGMEDDYFFADYIASNVYHIEPNGPRDGVSGSATPIVSDAGGPVDVVTGPDGALYYVAINIGQVRRVQPAVVPTDVDHYMCYRARLVSGQPKLPRGTTIDLEDELDVAPQTFKVTRNLSVCNPARRNGSALVEPTVHQQGFAISRVPGSPRFVKVTREIVDGFGGRTLTATRVDSLLTPSSQVLGAGGAPPYGGTAVDHYKCYSAKIATGTPKFVAPAPPSVVDQLYPGGQTFNVRKPTKLCNPVAADGSPILHGASHLACYQVRLPSGVRFTRQTVSASNADFGDDVLLVTAPTELCLPAAVDP